MRSTLNIGTLRAGAIAVGDFNRDGKPDIAAAVYDSAAPSSSLYGDQLLLLQGNGDGTFSMVSGSMGLNPAPTNALRVADVNGDQNPDLVVVSNNYLSVFFGNGVFSSSTPPFTPANGYYYSPNGNMAGIDIADFNFDGMPDLVVPDGGIDGVGVAAVQVFFNSTPTFSATPSVVDVYSAAGTNPAGITFTVSTASTVPGTYSIYSSQPVYVAPSLSSNGLPGTSIFTANFNTASLPPGNYQFPITLASATYFQRQVLIKLHVRAPAGTLRVASNNATGAGTSPVLIRTGDFNKDGKLDYAALSSAATPLSVPSRFCV